ncbi:MAG: SDR family oxidoreductase [Novosphingobium sp.]|nr:SDR family oxidoreductase [Novosphingobium sp.]
MAEPGINERADLPLAVIVGAGGLGLAICRRLGQSHQLLIADRDEDRLAAISTMLNDEGHDTAALPCDITNDDDVARLADHSRGAAKTLVHVAALSVSAGDFRKVLSVNIGGAARVANAFRDALVPHGSAVFISSSSAHMGMPDPAVLDILDDPLSPDFAEALEAAIPPDSVSAGGAYSLSKVAMNRMCRRLAPAWGRKGLRIVSLSPGLIATPMGAEAYRHVPAKRKLFEAVPLGREGTMLEIAGIVEFLVSDRAAYISGTDILADGGLLAGLAASQT